jgi:hypothetical protein
MVDQKDQVKTAYGGGEGEHDSHHAQNSHGDKHQAKHQPQQNPYKAAGPGDKRKDGFKTPSYGPDKKGPVLDGPALKSPEHKPKPPSEYKPKPRHNGPYKQNGPNLDGPAFKSPKTSKDQDYWYGDDDSDHEHNSGRGREDEYHRQDDDDHMDDVPMRKEPRKYKSLDDSAEAETPSFSKSPESSPAPASKETKDASSTDSTDSSSTEGNKEGCIKMEDVPANKGGYKFVPPSQRKNLCKTPAPAPIPEDKESKEFKPISEDEEDTPDRKDHDSDRKRADDTPDREADSDDDKREKRSFKRDKVDDDTRHREKREKERQEATERAAEEREKQEEEAYDRWYPWPIVRDEDIDFIVPNKVKDDFWNKANKQGFMYMPKWDPVLAKYYHPKIDRAGNNPVDTSDIEPNKGQWKSVGGKAVEKTTDSRPAPEPKEPFGDRDEERHSRGSRDSRPESVKPKQKPVPMAAPVTRQPSSSKSSSSSSDGAAPQRGSSPSASTPHKSEPVAKGKATMPHTQSRANPGQNLPGHMVPSVRSDAPQIPKYDFYGNIIPTSGSINSGSSASYSYGGGSSFYDPHAGPQWHYSFGKVYPKADQQAGMASLVTQHLSTHKPADSKAQPAVAADAQTNKQQQGQGQPVYWAYDQAGKLVPVYAGLDSADASIAAANEALRNIADSYTAVDDSTAMTEAEAAALYNAGSYELADEYEQVPVAIAAAADGTIADAADAAVVDFDTADADNADAEPAGATVSVASVDQPATTSSSTAAVAAAATPAAEDVVVISAIEVGHRQE